MLRGDIATISSVNKAINTAPCRCADKLCLDQVEYRQLRPEKILFLSAAVSRLVDTT